MKDNIFSGVCTALVTPFTDKGVALDVLTQLLEFQIRKGVRTVVLCGTTGESPTLSDREKEEIFRAASSVCRGRCRILAGTGSNDTQHAVALSQMAQEQGADGLLVVSPYYNKATFDGILAHYNAICQAVSIPVIAYNVPSRTGLDMSVAVYRELAKLEGLLGVKEAGGNISKIGEIFARCPRDFYVWSGNDDQTVPILALGGCGVVSVASNIVPKEMLHLVQAARDGNYPEAARLQRQLLPLMQALFSQVNPIPVKAALELMGFRVGKCRLPLTSLGEKEYFALKKEMNRLSIGAS